MLELLREKRRRLLRVDVRQWAPYYLSSYFTLSQSPFHQWLGGELTGLAAKRGTRLNVVAPRGSAKSTWAAEAYPLYCAVEGLESYIVITSDTGPQAVKRLDAIRSELETNEKLAQDYPWAVGRGPVWRSHQLLLRNGVMIEAMGTGTQLRGRKNRQYRPSLIIVDDPQNTEHIISALQRDRSWEWLTKDVSNAGDTETNIIALGTALHRDCIVLRLQRTAGWRSRLFQSIVSWPDRMDLWQQWEWLYCNWGDPDREAAARHFYESNREEMDAGADVLWPERESLYSLMCLRVTIGAGAFGSEKQGSPINPESCEWPETYFDGAGFWFEQWPTEVVARVMALDPSKGKDARRGDYSAFVKLMMDREGVLFVEGDLQRRDSSQIVADGVEHVRQFQPDIFGVEANQFQELLLEPFRQEAARQSIPLPMVPMENTVNKLVRIRRLGPYLSQRKIRFKAASPGTSLLVQQLQEFPVGAHDDGADGAEMAVRLMNEYLQALGDAEHNSSPRGYRI